LDKIFIQHLPERTNPSIIPIFAALHGKTELFFTQDKVPVAIVIITGIRSYYFYRRFPVFLHYFPRTIDWFICICGNYCRATPHGTILGFFQLYSAASRNSQSATANLALAKYLSIYRQTLSAPKSGSN